MSPTPSSRPKRSALVFMVALLSQTAESGNLNLQGRSILQTDNLPVSAGPSSSAVSSAFSALPIPQTPVAESYSYPYSSRSSQNGYSFSGGPRRLREESPTPNPNGNVPAKTGGSQTGGPINQECVELHNRVRSAIGLSPLTVSPQLVQIATQRVKQASQVFDHSSGNFGENLYQQTPGKNPPTCSDAFQRWYNQERPQYNGGGFSTNTGHFTQIMARQTTQIGCASSRSSGTFVCTYSPAGNDGTPIPNAENAPATFQ